MWKPSVAPIQTQQPPVTEPIVKSNVAMFPTAQPQAFIGKSICIKGEIRGSESLRIDGQVEGTIDLASNALHIGRDATVISKVAAQELVVCGILQGNSTIGDRLEIRNGGSLVGNVATKRISIEEGAHFKGSIDMRPLEHKTSADESI